MTNFLTRLVDRTAGRMPLAQPRILPRYAPVAEPGAVDSGAPDESDERMPLRGPAVPRTPAAALEPEVPPVHRQEAAQVPDTNGRRAALGKSVDLAAARVNDQPGTQPDTKSSAPAEAQVPGARTLARPARSENPVTARGAQDTAVSAESVETERASVSIQRAVPSPAAPRLVAGTQGAVGAIPKRDAAVAASSAPVVPDAAPSKPSTQTEPASPGASAPPGAHRTQREPAAPPPVRISIGKIEVRAAAPAPQVAPAPRSAPPPRLAMADYMQQSRGKRT